jgi:hypothetical protein
VAAHPQTLVHSHFLAPPLSPPIVSESSGGQRTARPKEWRRRKSTHRRATLIEGECAIIERSRGDALSRESERINPRVDIDERQVPFPDSNEVGSGDGGPR